MKSGIRLVISTQSPRTLPAELLELASLTLLHSFHSRSWYDYLRGQLPLTTAITTPDGRKESFHRLCEMPTGRALVMGRGRACEEITIRYVQTLTAKH